MKKNNLLKCKIGDIELEFKTPSLIAYAEIITNLKERKPSRALEVLFDSTVNSVDYDGDIAEKSMFFGFLSDKFLNFKSPTIDIEDNCFILTIEDKEIKLRIPDRNEYMEIFDLSVYAPLKAWQTAYDKLYIDGYKFNYLENVDDLMTFVSCYDIPSVLMDYKSYQLKKKSKA